MKTNEDLKALVREKYAEIAKQSKKENESSCCGVGGCNEVDYSLFAEDYKQIKGHHDDADLGLGCGIPTQFAHINHGDTVLDLGSGAGNDAFVARELCGSEGKVIGIDMTEAMINKSRNNADKLGFNNVEFRLGDIEKMPVGGNSIDVVLSNCVMNLVPDKEKAFAETFRVLKPGAHFSISDVVIRGCLPEKIKEAAELYAGCVSGAIPIETYIHIIRESGFINIKLLKDKEIEIPENILLQYINKHEIDELKHSDTGIYSITVYAEKAHCKEESNCC